MYLESAEAKSNRGRKLRAAVIKRGVTARNLSEKLGCHINSVYRWFKDPSYITILQADGIATILKLTGEETLDIFFPGQCAQTKQRERRITHE